MEREGRESSCGKLTLRPSLRRVFVRTSGFVEGGDEFSEFLIAQVPKLSSMAIAHRFGQGIEQHDTCRSDADLNDAAVLRLAFASHEAALVELVEQARHVRCTRDEPCSERRSRQCSGLRGAEQSQRVVLLRREVVSSKKLVFQGPQAIIGAPELQICGLFEGIELLRPTTGGWGSGRSGHTIISIGRNNRRQDNTCLNRR